METVKQLLEVVDQKNKIDEVVSRLSIMKGLSADRTPRPKCDSIQFSSAYGAHAIWYSSRDNGALNMLLVETALQYFNEQSDKINEALTTAEGALHDAFAKETGLDD